MSQRVDPDDGRIPAVASWVGAPFTTFFDWTAGVILGYVRFLLLSVKEFSLAVAATGPVALVLAYVLNGGALTPTHAVYSMAFCLILAHLVASGR
jgi:hypothetical protein